MGTFFFSKNGQYFPTKKKIKGKKKKRPPYWLQKNTPAGPETEVFLEWPWCIESQFFRLEVYWCFLSFMEWPAFFLEFLSPDLAFTQHLIDRFSENI